MQASPVVDTMDADLSKWDDQDLLGHYVRTEQPEVLTEIVQRYYPLVFSIVSRNLHSSQDIQDGVQATFLILVKSAAKIRRRRSLAAWLHGVAYRTSRRLRERVQREHSMHSESSPVETLACIEESPLAIIAKQMQLDALDEELQLVCEAYRAVLIDHYLLGQTAAQIATRCNLSQATVEGRLRRGRQQLRMRMLRRGFGFSTAVAFASQAIQANQVPATELAAFVDGLQGCGSSAPTDIPTSVSTLITQETHMTQFVSDKLWLAAFATTTSIAVFGLLAVTAVGEQTEQKPAQELATTAPAQESPASTIVPSSEPTSQAAHESPATAASPVAAAWPAPPVNRVQRALQSNVDDVFFIDTPLKQALEELGDDSDFAFRLDEGELERLGLDIDSPVTLQLRTIPLHQTLDYVLSPLELSYRIEGDILHVSSREKLDQRPSLRVYDLSIFETPQLGKALEQQIRNIQPDQWENRRWSINLLPEERLLISASDPAHFEIERLLVDLAQQLGKKLPQMAEAKPTENKRKQAVPSPATVDDPFGASDNPFGDSPSPPGTNNDPFGSGK